MGKKAVMTQMQVLSLVIGLIVLVLIALNAGKIMTFLSTKWSLVASFLGG